MTAGVRLLRAYCLKEGIDSAELARRVHRAVKGSGGVPGVRKPKHPPYTGARLWLRGTWTPQIHWRKAIAYISDGAVPESAWTEVVP